MGTWKTMNPRRILHAPGAISVHDGVLPASLEPGTSGLDLNPLSTGPPRPEHTILFLCLRLTALDSRELNPLSYTQQKTELECANQSPR